MPSQTRPTRPSGSAREAVECIKGARVAPSLNPGQTQPMIYLPSTLTRCNMFPFDLRVSGSEEALAQPAPRCQPPRATLLSSGSRRDDNYRKIAQGAVKQVTEAA